MSTTFIVTAKPITLETAMILSILIMILLFTTVSFIPLIFFPS